MASIQRAIEAFRELQARDPNRVQVGGELRPKALVEAERLASWVERLAPDAGAALRIAPYCQHLERWRLPRSDFPDGRKGYIAWRTNLAKYHAEKSGQVLMELGFEPAVIQAVQRINLKKGLGQASDAQVMEDALCLCFLEFELAAFAAKHPREKLVDIIQKTWRKMSDVGHQQASSLPLTPELSALVREALA
ncbi:MAG: DUF4202 domain-containing protein [Myxococcales bacterium]|nr:DUF4202 domain-containing protein [Myxococcales bacterium]